MTFHPAFYNEGRSENGVRHREALLKTDHRSASLTKKNQIHLRPEAHWPQEPVRPRSKSLELSQEVTQVFLASTSLTTKARTDAKETTYSTSPKFSSATKKTLGKGRVETRCTCNARASVRPEGEIKHLLRSKKRVHTTRLPQSVAVTSNVAAAVICESPELEKDALSFEEDYELALRRRRQRTGCKKKTVN